MKSVKALYWLAFFVLALLLMLYVYQVVVTNIDGAKCEKLSDEIEKSECIKRVAKSAHAWGKPWLSNGNPGKGE